jgi:putative addiction module component (TIGR02574 family)
VKKIPKQAPPPTFRRTKAGALVLDPKTKAEIRRRVDEIRSGKEKGTPGEVVPTRIRKIVGR